MLRDEFGSMCETYSPSQGSCDLFVSGSQLWISWNAIRAVAKSNRWTYEVMIEGARTRVRFMTGSPLWDYASEPVVDYTNVTIKHALENGFLCPKYKSTRAVHAGTTETVHISAATRCQTRVSVRLAEALLDRRGVLDIHLRRGELSVVCASRLHFVSAPRWHERKKKGAAEAEARIQSALRRIRKHRRRSTSSVARQSAPGAYRAGGAGKVVSGVSGRKLSSIVQQATDESIGGNNGVAAAVAPDSAAPKSGGWVQDVDGFSRQHQGLGVASGVQAATALRSFSSSSASRADTGV